MVDGGHPTIDTFLIRPNAYPAKILEKGCSIWPDNRGCTVFSFFHMRQKNYWSYFAFSQTRLVEGKIDTAFWHFQNLTRKCLFGIRGKSTAGVILPLGESDWLDWSSDKDDALGLV